MTDDAYAKYDYDRVQDLNTEADEVYKKTVGDALKLIEKQRVALNDLLRHCWYLKEQLEFDEKRKDVAGG